MVIDPAPTVETPAVRPPTGCRGMGGQNTLRFAYALTAAGADHYAAAVAVSASAVLRLHPEAKVTVVVDECTYRSGVEKLPWWPAGVDFRTVHTGIAGSMERSRYVKTHVPRLVERPFVFLDADTIPVRRLDDLFFGEADLKAVPNRCRGAVFVRFPPESESGFEALDWSRPSFPYLNSGVWYLGDGPAADLFAARWHTFWQDFYKRTGRAHDQPAFNHAADDVQREAALGVAVLPLHFNAFVDLAPCFARGASIWHFYTRNGRPVEGSLLADLVGDLVKTGRVNWSQLDTAVAEERAWHAKLCDDTSTLEDLLKDGQAAHEAGDSEVAWRLVGERIRRKPYSMRTWRLASRIVVARMAGVV